MTRPEKIPAQTGFEPGIFRSRGGRLTTRPTRRSQINKIRANPGTEPSTRVHPDRQCVANSRVHVHLESVWKLKTHCVMNYFQGTRASVKLCAMCAACNCHWCAMCAACNCHWCAMCAACHCHWCAMCTACALCVQHVTVTGALCVQHVCSM